MSWVEIPEEVEDMAGDIYRFLSSLESDINTWYGSGVIRMMMRVPNDDTLLFRKGMWLLVIRNVVEHRPNSNSYRLRR